MEDKEENKGGLNKELMMKPRSHGGIGSGGDRGIGLIGRGTRIAYMISKTKIKTKKGLTGKKAGKSSKKKQKKGINKKADQDSS